MIKHSITKHKYVTLNLIVLFTMLTIQPLVEYYFARGEILAVISFRLIFIYALGFPFILYYLGIRPKLNKYKLFLLLVFLSNILITIVFVLFNDLVNFSNLIIYYNIINALFIASIDLKIIKKALNIVVNMGLIIFPFLLVYILKDFDIDVALRRGYTWTFSFYIAAMFWAIIPFSIISFVDDKKFLKPLIYISAALFLNVIFIKRAIFVDIFLIAFVYITHKILSRDFSIKSIITFLIFMGIIYIFMVSFFNNTFVMLFNAIFERFDNSAENITSFDRFVESANYFKSIDIFDFILGKGYLSYHYGLGHQSYALHVGWANWIFKGGLLLIITVLIPNIKSFYLMFQYKRLPVKIRISVLVVFVYSIYLVYSNLHSFVPSLIIYFYFLFNVSSYSMKNQENFKVL